jgi:hypothetical protein
MNWNIKDHGDPFEKECSDFISLNIPTYNEFWSLYVGNNNGKPAHIKGINNKLNRKRQYVAQWNYTLLRNIYTTQTIYNRNINKKMENGKYPIEQEIDYILSTHLFYNTIEVIDKIRRKIQQNEIKPNYIGNFLLLRNYLTHNIRPLIKIENQVYQVPKNLEWFDGKFKKGSKPWIWSNFNSEGLVFQDLSEFLKWCLSESINMFNNVLSKEIKYFNDEFNLNPSNQKISIGDSYSKNNVASGTTGCTSSIIK